MKLTTFRTFMVFVCSIGLISYVIAGPGASSDHSRGNSNDVSGPGFGPDNNPGQQGKTASDGSKFDSSNNPGDQGSQFGKSTASNASSNGSQHENANAIGRGEKVIETSDVSGETESGDKGEKAETDPKFKGSLLDQGLPDRASAKPDESPKGTPPGHHYGWEKGKHNPHREASVSPSPSASASASATASATSTPAATASPTG